MSEKWKIIKEFPNYQISTLGNIRNRKSGKVRKQRLYNGGYCVLFLTNKKLKKTLKIHRLVAKAFIPNFNNLPVVHHKNHIPSDNRVENLEWTDFRKNAIGNYTKKLILKIETIIDLHKKGLSTLEIINNIKSFRY